MNLKDKMQLIEQYIDVEKFSTEKTVKILCAITPFIDDILKDKEIQEIWNSSVNVEGMEKEDAEKALEEKIKENFLGLIPIFLGKYDRQIYTILSILNEKPVEEIKKQNIFVTISELEDLMSKKGIEQKDVMGFSE